MRILHAPIGAPPPFFLREEFFGDAFCLAFLGVSKTRVRSGIARTDRRMSQKNILQRTAGHFQRTSGYGAATIHAKLSGAAHARRAAGAAIACAHRFGLARAVRFAGIVPLLHQEALPPGAHMLRRRPGGVRLEALVPQEGQAQDAAERMEPARAPQVVVTPHAAKPTPPRPLRWGARSAISRWSNNSRAAVARRGYFGLSPPRFVPAVPHRARRAFSFPGQLRCLAP